MEKSISIKDSLKLNIEDIANNSDAIILKLDGLIDTYNSSLLQKEVLNTLSSYTKVIFDCSKLTYVSSTGIGTFTVFLKHVKEKNGTIILTGLQQKVLEIFQLLGFSKFFNIIDTLDESLKTLGITSNEESCFPKVLECPSCSKKLKASKPGKFRCIQCNAIICISYDGSISSV
jgi:anti-anti-sigma factor